ncbi:ergosterol biosynthesis ERG4/ERG24 family [Actinidia rufa]|uniref:Ergosterol biosynthesis ERG4/ERG24 family n=1 Tax=Actinidia rufa TaxID=165716 RepID=A0A7J0GIX6_9ERIC|nr:ergosterol biosynthesis ERG4/ERG24 family [Actinidia rufa]
MMGWLLINLSILAKSVKEANLSQSMILYQIFCVSFSTITTAQVSSGDAIAAGTLRSIAWFWKVLDAYLCCKAEFKAVLVVGCKFATHSSSLSHQSTAASLSSYELERALDIVIIKKHLPKRCYCLSDLVLPQSFSTITTAQVSSGDAIAAGTLRSIAWFWKVLDAYLCCKAEFKAVLVVGCKFATHSSSLSHQSTAASLSSYELERALDVSSAIVYCIDLNMAVRGGEVVALNKDCTTGVLINCGQLPNKSRKCFARLEGAKMRFHFPKFQRIAVALYWK